MARWGKSFVVPLDSLIKEKENTNRPVAARSAGTVGKWGKMGFTSTRTYGFKAFSAVSPTEVPDNLEPSQAAHTNDPPKPKKFFKSRNASVDIIRTQIIQHLPRAPPSPIREVSPKKEPSLKIRIAKPTTTERKKSTSSDKGIKIKKKKDEKKKLKPEAPPSRIISRQRKVVNYNEEDDDEENNQKLVKIKDAITVPTLSNNIVSSQSVVEKEKQNLNNSMNSSGEYVGDPGVKIEDVEAEAEPESEQENEPIMEPPPVTPKQSNVEHPPIVLRISKGTSRLISTDSEEIISSPVQKSPVIEQPPPAIASTEELLSVLSGEPTSLEQTNEKITVNERQDEMQLINSNTKLNCKTIKESEIESNEDKTLSQVEPQKYESLKIVIKKTDALKNTFVSGKTERKTKSRKHKKNVINAAERLVELSSPKLTTENQTLMSPLPQSEKDFDSQSSILGSVSSKSTNQFPAVIADGSCVIRSHGSSDITSDLETSQHSSLVAPPSDIESRLESMMDCDDDLPPIEPGESAAAFGGVDNKSLPIQEEPLKEDILQVLTGGNSVDKEDIETIIKDTSPSNATNAKVSIQEELKTIVGNPVTCSPTKEETVTKRQTRSKKRKVLDKTDKPTIETTTIENSKTTKKVGRVTRNNNNLKNNVNVLPPTRSYTRRRKTVQISPETESLKIATNQQIQEDNTSKTAAIDLPDAPVVDTSANSQFDETALKKTDDEQHDDAYISELHKKNEEKQYKIKNKLKRTWYERDYKKVEEGEEEEEEDYENSTATDEPAKKKFNSVKKVDIEAEGDLLSMNNNNNGNSNGRNYRTGRESSSPHLTGDDEKPSVKLVISKKKGSIFKSRALVADQGGETNSAKKRAVYKHTWDDDNSNKEKEKSITDTPTPSDSGDTIFDDDFSVDAAVPKFSRLTRQNVTSKQDEETVTSVKCDRKAKDYYTVVRNVKTAHQIQEIGEYQEMKDDVDYILDALQPHNPISTRCLSALQLATKCSTPAFRMHVRAHGTVGKFFKALKDAKYDLSLGLCTATIMFVLSQDTLNIDLDRDSLELMINLLEVDLKKNSSDEENVTYERNKQKVRELCEEIKNQGKATHLNLETISTGTLAMETLLSLTSKKAGEWFKEELRELGGLEHIIKTICDCCYQISDYVVNWTEILLDKLKTIERCLRVLENISELNKKNQDYILSYSNGHAIDTLFKLYKLCDSEIALYPTNDATPKDNPGVVLREALVPTLKVLINLTHPFDKSASGSALLGQRVGIFDTSFHILLQAPNYVPERCIFELSILVLLLLINLTMYTIPNRTLIMKSHAQSDFGNQFDKVPAIKALIEYFYRCHEQALLAEQNTDEMLENPESSNKKPQSQEEMDETVTKLLQKAGHHMEHTLQASYAGILIGHLISESSDNEIVIRSYLKDHQFQDIINVLEKYYTFMNLTASSEASMVSHKKSTKNLIDYFKKCDAHSNDDDDNSASVNYHHRNQNHNNINSGDIDVPSSSSGSSISTRSVTTRYYKSYSQR